jgi:hypothetical protein
MAYNFSVAGETSQVDGHTVVRNSEPALPMLELEREELWRRGGEIGGFIMQTMAASSGPHLIVAGSRSLPQEKFTERAHFLAAIDQDGNFLSLDLYDAQGHWQREVRLVCEGSSVSDGFRFPGDGRILLIKGFVVARLACLGSGTATLGEDETETIEVICYRLPQI